MIMGAGAQGVVQALLGAGGCKINRRVIHNRSRHTTFLRRDQLFGEAMLPEVATRQPNTALCQAGQHMKSQLMLARTLSGAAPGSATDSELVRQSIYYLVSHEVGHTLGLNHNFRASQMLSPDELQDVAIGAERGVAASWLTR